MNFADLVTDVQVWVKAPHMDGAIRSAIRSTTLFYHRKEKFWRDLTFVTISGLPLSTTQIIDLSLLPRFRQLKSVTGCDLIEFNDLVDSTGYAKVNIAFMAGTSLNVKTYSAITSLDICYYQDPIVTETGYTSWIADTQPDLIIAGSAARALAWKAESDIYKAAVATEAMQWMALIQNNIEGVGR